MKTMTKTKTQTQVSTRVAVTSIVAAAFGAGLIAYGFSIGYIQINPNPVYVPPEICDNKIDDDKDGLIDCKDTTNCPLGSSKCPDCKGVTVSTRYGPDYYRFWGVGNEYYKKWDVLNLTIRNNNTNPLCELRPDSAKFGLKKPRAGWNIKDIKLYNETAGWTTIAGPGACDTTKNICNYDWSISNVSLKPGEEINVRVQADVTGGLQFKDGVYFYLHAPAGFTSKDTRGGSYSFNTPNHHHQNPP